MLLSIFSTQRCKTRNRHKRVSTDYKLHNGTVTSYGRYTVRTHSHLGNNRFGKCFRETENYGFQNACKYVVLYLIYN